MSPKSATRLLYRLASAATIVLGLHVSVASARTLAVPRQFPTIKGAMIAATPGDIVLVGCGTYFEADIQIKSGVSLWSGTLQPDCVTIDAGGQGRCLVFINADSTTNVVGFTLRGGRIPATSREPYGGAVLIKDASPHLTRCVLNDNEAPDGGAVACLGQSQPRFENCRFQDNRAETDGGAVFWSASGGNIATSIFRGNLALAAGGAVAIASGTASLRDCLLEDNTAGCAGGAISVSAASTLLAGCLLTHNTGGLGGGAVAGFSGRISLIQTTLVANTADGPATAVLAESTPMTFDHALITHSTRPALQFSGEQPVVERSNFHFGKTAGWPVGVNPSANSISLDPLYCSPESRDYHLRADSPCLGPNPGATIGALGQGCGTRFPADMVD